VGSARTSAPARAVISIFIFVLVGLQAWAILAYRDDWPFASNSMFSFEREPGEQVYDLRLRVEVDGRWRRLAPVTDLGAPDEESFRRLFFTRWYGSSDPEYPQRAFDRDSRQAFVARMSEFCRTVEEEMASRGMRPEALAVAVAELRREGDEWVIGWEHPVGECSPIDAGFQLRTA
jgi:hypothetical protein